MTLADRERERELPRTGLKESKSQLHSGSLASVESLSRPNVQEVVLSADIRCSGCQKRIAEIISRMDETESVVVDLLEKKVILTCRYSNVAKASAKQVVQYRHPPGKIAMIKRIFRSSRD